MNDPILGQVSLVGFIFSPENWEYCNGEDMPIKGNEQLFSLIGTIYGGDGRVNFFLPDLTASMPRGIGPKSDDSSLSLVKLGQKGSSSYNIDISNIPTHTHDINITDVEVDFSNINIDFNIGKGGQVVSNPDESSIFSIDNKFENNSSDTIELNPNCMTLESLEATGSFNNATTESTGSNNCSLSMMAPFLGLNYVICTLGAFPQRD